MKQLLFSKNPSNKFFFATVFSFLIFKVAPCQIGSQGPNNTDSVTQSPSIACLSCPGVEWQNANNVKLADGLYAQAPVAIPYGQCIMSSCYYSRALIAANFRFTIPTNAVISGIKAEVLRYGSSDSISDHTVELYRGAPDTSSNKADTAFWPTTPATASYGDSTDLWNSTWAPADINSADFGLYYIVQHDGHILTVTNAFVDNILLTVYYVIPTGVTMHQTQSSQTAYPYYDPVNQSIEVKNSPPGLIQYRIYNSLGQQVLKQEKNEKLNVASLPPGVYVATILGRDEKYNLLKFCKTR